MENQTRIVEIHGKTYELRPHEDGIVVEILGTLYEIYEREQNFDVYRIDADCLAMCCGSNVNSQNAAIELAEIFERLVIFTVSTGLVSELEMIKYYLEQWQSSPPYKIDI